jgi:hypothetical protein
LSKITSVSVRTMHSSGISGPSAALGARAGKRSNARTTS